MAITSISEKIRDPRSKKRNLVMFFGTDFVGSSFIYQHDYRYSKYII